MAQDHGHEGLRNIGESKDGGWSWQVRINLAKEFAAAARADLNDPALEPLKTVLDKHGVTLKNQYDAFANYCREAEAAGETDTTLYRWTKATIDNPMKEVAYATRFTVYQGENQIYSKELADAVEADMLALQETGMVTKVNKIDSDPAKNPQAPAKFQR